MELSEVRARIDTINGEMLRLFLERMELVKDVAAAKKEAGLPVYDEKREREILKRVAASAGDDMSGYAEKLFESVFAISREYQETMM